LCQPQFGSLPCSYCHCGKLAKPAVSCHGHHSITCSAHRLCYHITEWAGRRPVLGSTRESIEPCFGSPIH
jgi:hypothetical protein